MRALKSLAILSLFPILGCVLGSLATDTGSSTEGVWSVARVQDAHIGETVRFSFVLRDPFREGRLGLGDFADYASAQILGERIDVEPSIDNRFEMAYTLWDVEPGRTVKVRFDAFQIRDRKDAMQIRGRWVRSQSANNAPDRWRAGASLGLHIYQSQVNYTFRRPMVDLDWSTARLAIARRDGTVSTIFVETQHRRGFVRSGPDDKGFYHVHYRPTADQVNRTDRTAVTFVVLDVEGHEHRDTFEIETP